jgi:uncharacterized protein
MRKDGNFTAGSAMTAKTHAQANAGKSACSCNAAAPAAKARATRVIYNPTRPGLLRLTMPRKYFRKYLPDADRIRSTRLVRFFGGWLQHPNLWCLNRRSVAGAVAIGLFSGLVPGPLQMLTALLLAIPLRKNLPVALFVTFYTNPFTIVPLYLLAYGYGKLILGINRDESPVQPFDWDWGDFWASTQALGAWMLGLGKPLAIGLPALAITLAALGYFVVELAWRAYVVGAWRARARRRAHR